MTILHFLPHILPVFIDCFLLIMNMFFGQIPANSANVYLQHDVAFFLHLPTGGRRGRCVGAPEQRAPGAGQRSGLRRGLFQRGHIRHELRRACQL